MKRKTFYIALSVTVLAIIVVGACSAYRQLYISVPEANADIDMQLVYANFWASTNTDNNANISGSLTSYITVINITNHASQTAFITDVTIMVAQDVTVYPLNANSSHVFSGMQIQVTGTSLSDEREGLQLQVEPGSYRLVAVTGLTTSTDVLQGIKLFLKAGAEPAYVKGEATSVYDIKDLYTFQHTNNGILYNELLTGNQTLTIDGLNASINYPVSINDP